MSPPQLVFLHGWGMHCSIWDGIVAEFRSHNAVAASLPGYGNTPFCAGGCGDLAAALSARFDGPLVICGWSLGSQVAMRWALAAPQQVERLVLVGASPRFVATADWECGVAQRVFTQFAAELALNYAKTIGRFLTLQADAGDRATLRELRQTLTHVEPSFDTLRQGLDLLRHEDLRNNVADIRMPTLIVNGERDMLVPRCAAEFLARAIPHAELALVADAGHAPFLSHRADFVRRLKAFLNG